MCSSLVSHHGIKNDEYYSCSELVSPHDFKNEECYIREGLVLPHGLKNDKYVIGVARFRIMALRTTYISCVARLFSLMAN